MKVHIQKEKIALKFENINVRANFSTLFQEVNSTHFFLSLQNIYNTSVQFEVKEYGKFMISFFRVLFSPDDVEFFKILWWRFSSSQVLRETPGAALHTENRKRRRGPAKGQVLLTTQWFIIRTWTTFHGSKWKWISESE